MLIEIVNWSKHNPRNDYKSIPWFRLSTRLPRDEKLFGASSDTKWTFVTLMCLAAEENKSGLISSNLEWICDAVKLPADKVEATLKELQERGLIQFVTNVRRTSAVRKTNVPRSLRTNEHNERTNEETDKDSGFAPVVLFDLWNTHRGTLTPALRLTATRATKIRVRRSEAPDPSYWETVIKRLAASDFATGKNDRAWKASLDWLIENDSNHVKVAEGRYDNRGPKPRKETYTVVTDLSQLDD